MSKKILYLLLSVVFFGSLILLFLQFKRAENSYSPLDVYGDPLTAPRKLPPAPAGGDADKTLSSMEYIRRDRVPFAPIPPNKPVTPEPIQSSPRPIAAFEEPGEPPEPTPYPKPRFKPTPSLSERSPSTETSSAFIKKPKDKPGRER